MKIQIPDDLKADMPQTTWGKVLSATPIVMTVIATMLAGLASSEMTRAQYDRSLAAQQQSKSGDQWGLFQAKRLRGALQRNTLDVLENTTALAPLDTAALRSAATGSELSALLATPDSATALACLADGRLPKLPAPPALDPAIAAVQSALDRGLPDAEISPLLAAVTSAAIDAAVRAAHDHSAAFDDAMKPTAKAIDALERALARPDTPPALRRSYTAARLRFNAARYDAEARLNQTIGALMDVQVRKSNLSAERHHFRSQRFFYGMLGAQMGVIIATFAMAARKRNLLWSLAAAAGVTAVGFAGYVYMFV